MLDRNILFILNNLLIYKTVESKVYLKNSKKDVNELENEFNIEFEEIKNNSNKNKMIKMLHNITETFNKKIAKLNKDFQEFKNFQIQKINEINSRNNKKIRKRFV